LGVLGKTIGVDSVGGFVVVGAGVDEGVLLVFGLDV
jgi:hypothetical protein